jgi:hypothetical protein
MAPCTSQEKCGGLNGGQGTPRFQPPAPADPGRVPDAHDLISLRVMQVQRTDATGSIESDLTLD